MLSHHTPVMGSALIHRPRGWIDNDWGGEDRLLGWGLSLAMHAGEKNGDEGVIDKMSEIKRERDRDR